MGKREEEVLKSQNVLNDQQTNVANGHPRTDLLLNALSTVHRLNINQIVQMAARPHLPQSNAKRAIRTSTSLLILLAKTIPKAQRVETPLRNPHTVRHIAIRALRLCNPVRTSLALLPPNK